ncbi:MAG: hypothetical protein ACR2LF_07870 [Jatrophihabitantaceae bacterium]
MRGRIRRGFRSGAAALAALTVLSACSSLVAGKPITPPKAPNAQLAVHGDSGSAFDTTTKNSLSDVMAFWRTNYPKLSGGKALPPLKGGLYSVDGADVLQTKKVTGPAAQEACIQRDPTFIVDNAAFCLLDDSIVWDRDPLHLVGVLMQKYGPLTNALVFAHEFGHAIQYRLKIDTGNTLPTIDIESQADCAAGAFMAAALASQAPHYHPSAADLDGAINGLLQVRDSTPNPGAPLSHGNGFDRVSAIDDGLLHGVTFCYSPSYFNRTFTERPYVTDQDYLSGGNECLEQVTNAGAPPADPTACAGGGGLQPDLNRFWTAAATSIHKSWTDVKIAEAPHPKCGSSSSASEFGYCPTDNTVYFSTSFAHQAYYSLTTKKINPTNGNVTLIDNQPADFALGALFAIGWGLAVRHQLFNRGIVDQNALLSAICYTGAYAKNVNSATKTGFALSPPDMDEATSAVLNLVGLDKAFGSRGTTGLQRVQSFVKGYGGGLSVC